MATRKKGATGVAPAPKPEPEPEPAVVFAPYVDPYAVQVAREDFSRLDPRERAARAGNCLTNGHPTAEFVKTPLGDFCPHCASYVGV